MSTSSAPTCSDCLQVGNNGGIEGLVVDTAGRYISSSYARRISLHEAGHFLIAYLIGLLPKVYTLSTLDAVQRSVTKDVVTNDFKAVCRPCSRMYTVCCAEQPDVVLLTCLTDLIQVASMTCSTVWPIQVCSAKLVHPLQSSSVPASVCACTDAHAS